MNVTKQISATEYTISDVRYSVRPFPAMDSAGVLGDLLSVIAPAIGTVGRSVMMSKSETLEGMMGDVSVDEITGKLSGLNGTTLKKIIKELLIDSQNIYFHHPSEPLPDRFELLNMDTFNELFCQGLDDALILCGHVIKLNFGSFFGRFAARYGKATEEAGKRIMTASAALTLGASHASN